MGEIEQYVERVRAARRDYAALSLIDFGEPGPPDAETGERWDRGHVLGHVAEMLPYWTGQVRQVVAGGRAMGRDQAGAARRREGIDGSRDAQPAALLETVDGGLADLEALLGEMDEADLDRSLTYTGAGAAREMDLRAALEQVLIGHAEEHARQLRELG